MPFVVPGRLFLSLVAIDAPVPRRLQVMLDVKVRAEVAVLVALVVDRIAMHVQDVARVDQTVLEEREERQDLPSDETAHQDQDRRDRVEQRDHGDDGVEHRHALQELSELPLLALALEIRNDQASRQQIETLHQRMPAEVEEARAVERHRRLCIVGAVVLDVVHIDVLDPIEFRHPDRQQGHRIFEQPLAHGENALHPRRRADARREDAVMHVGVLDQVLWEQHQQQRGAPQRHHEIVERGGDQQQHRHRDHRDRIADEHARERGIERVVQVGREPAVRPARGYARLDLVEGRWLRGVDEIAARENTDTAPQRQLQQDIARDRVVGKERIDRLRQRGGPDRRGDQQRQCEAFQHTARHQPRHRASGEESKPIDAERDDHEIDRHDRAKAGRHRPGDAGRHRLGDAGRLRALAYTIRIVDHI